MDPSVTPMVETMGIPTSPKEKNINVRSSIQFKNLNSIQEFEFHSMYLNSIQEIEFTFN
jgi:hypothetical protein